MSDIGVTAKQRPLLSVVIPTYNRQQYLLSILPLIMSETSAEIVVSDNSDQPLAEQLLSALNANSRLIYKHHTDRLSVVGNFERGLGLATGEYLMFIGDDDCVGPGVDDVVRWAQANSIDAVVSYRHRFIANYFWPGVKSKYFGDQYAGKMFLSSHTGTATPFDAKAAIQKAASRPGAGLGGMARIYHGLVRRDLVERVVSKYGSLFGGVSPDIYSATLLSYEAKAPYIFDYPFVIPGATPVSTAGEGAARADVDGLKDREHIQRFGDALNWDPRIPEFYSPINVWAYSHLMALQKIDGPKFKLDFLALYIRSLLYYCRYRKNIFSAYRSWERSERSIGQFIGIPKILLAEIWSLMSRFWYKFLSPPMTMSNLETIGEAYFEVKKSSGLKNKLLTAHCQPPK